ncbi:MAG: hypothetical protein KAI43_06790 [Candidatus Aureabacteria bacterium]|nr:hypothetical protein [Candidatus Auribacterota bacterium]
MGWIGVDLDGTLAQYDKWKGPNHIGKPIPKMLKRVKEWIDKGQKVKIFTARAMDKEHIPPIKKWLEENGLGKLEVTNIKDYSMITLYDDRCVQVITNTGELIKEK